MNRQEIFDTVAKHLLTQKVKSKAAICLYRGPNGTKCAIGALIKDEFYDIEMECLGGLLVNSSAQWALKQSGVRFSDGLWSFLSQLQEIHDEHEPETWKDELDQFAKKHSLVPLDFKP